MKPRLVMGLEGSLAYLLLYLGSSYLAYSRNGRVKEWINHHSCMLCLLFFDAKHAWSKAYGEFQFGWFMNLVPFSTTQLQL